MTFDPFGWAATLIPERLLYRLINIAMAIVSALFMIRRIMEYPHFYLKPLWVVETAIFVVLLLAFLRRDDPVDRAVGMREVVVPVVGALLPFALLTSPPHAAVLANKPAVLSIFWVMTAGTALTVWGMWTLRRAFSITVEARRVVSRGPYRFVRHPVYFGEIIAAAAVAALRFSPENMILLTAFVVVQLLRSKWEEKKLATAFTSYRRETEGAWWLWRE